MPKPAANATPEPTNPAAAPVAAAPAARRASGKLARVKCLQRTPFVLELATGVDYGKARGKDGAEVAVGRGVVFSFPRAVPQNDGSIGVERVEREAAPSFTWFGGETWEVPVEFTELDAFKRACATGVLLVVS